MRQRNVTPFAHRLVIVAALLMPWSNAALSQAWKPQKPVELVVGSGPGGSADTTLRTIQKILQNEKLVDVPLAVVNKPGAGGAISWTGLNQHPGDGHYLAITFPNLLTNHIFGASPLRHTDITPLAHLSSDYIVVVVRADSPVKSGIDLADRLRRDPASLAVATATARGNAAHMAMGLAMKRAGVEVPRMKVIIYKSGGEVVPALLGGHVDVIITSPTVAAPQLQSGKVRVLAVSSPQRLTGAFAGVPTWNEQGIDAVFANWRGMVGPKGLTAAQVAYWDEVFTNLVRSDEWEKQVTKYLWMTTYLNSQETQRFLDLQYDELKGILKDLGVIK